MESTARRPERPRGPRPGVNVAQGGAGWTNLLFDQGSRNLTRVNETHHQGGVSMYYWGENWTVPR